MISTVQNLHAGNALRLFVQPPVGAVRWRILRKGDDTFVDENDPEAITVFEGDETVVNDHQDLQNEVMAFYRPFYTADGVTWSAGPTTSGTPSADYAEYSTDVLSLLRERIEKGLHVECERGNFQPEAGYIQVFVAAPSLERDLRFPLVTLHVESEDPAERFLGEDIGGDGYDMGGGEIVETEGWLANTSIAVIGWSMNGDERIELRKALRRVILANMPIFRDAGFDLITFSQSDVDALDGEYGVPLYQAMGNFSCIAPVRVGGPVDAIKSVISRSTNG